MGNTRLLAEVASYVDEQPEIVSWRQGHCLPYGEGITFWALGEVVKAQAGILESDDPEVATHKLQSAIDGVVDDSSEQDWFYARLAPLVGTAAEGSPNLERDESFTAWRRFLEAIASTGPLIVVFEDLHYEVVIGA